MPTHSALPHLPTVQKAIAADCTRQVMSSAHIHIPDRVTKVVRLNCWGMAAIDAQLTREAATMRLARAGAQQIDGRAQIVAHLERIRELADAMEADLALVDECRMDAQDARKLAVVA